MIKLLAFASLVVAAYGSHGGLHGGWNPEYCCYPVPEECCPPVDGTTTTTTTTTTEQPCPCLDVAFVVDISSSIGNVRLQTIIVPFLQEFANSAEWTIGTEDGEVQASMVTFANEGYFQWGWMSAETADSAALSSAFATLTTTQFQGLTNTGDALLVTRTMVLQGPGNRKPCPDVCVVITDGHVTREPDKFTTEAPLFRDACDISVVVGITTEVDPDELVQMATSFDNVIMIENFEDLAGIFNDVMDMIKCPGGGGGGGGSGTPAPPVTMPTTEPPHSGCCPYDYPYYFTLVGW